MLSQKKIGFVVLAFVSIMIVAATVSGIPTVSPPTVNTPSAPGALSHQQVGEVSVSSTGSEAIIPDVMIPVESKNSPAPSKYALESAGDEVLASGGDEQPVSADSWHYVGKTTMTQNWGTGSWYYKVFTLGNYGGASRQLWKVVMTAPRNNLNLKIFEKNKATGRWVLVKKGTRGTSNEVVFWTVKHNHQYKFYVYKASGPIARYTATLKFSSSR